MLLDSQSTLDLMFNPEMLTNIYEVIRNKAIRVHCNSGTKIVDRIGDMAGYGTVWYKPTNISNIISLSLMVHNFTMHSDSDYGGGLF